MRHSAALLRRIPGINHRLNRWIVLTSNRSNWPSPMKALSRRDLLKHRLNAAVKHSKSLTLLTDELSLSIEAIHNELMGIHGWSDEDAARIRRHPTAIVPFIASTRGFRQPHVGAIHSRWTAQALLDVGKSCVVAVRPTWTPAVLQIHQPLRAKVPNRTYKVRTVTHHLTRYHRAPRCHKLR